VPAGVGEREQVADGVVGVARRARAGADLLDQPAEVVEAVGGRLAVLGARAHVAVGVVGVGDLGLERSALLAHDDAREAVELVPGQLLDLPLAVGDPADAAQRVGREQRRAEARARGRGDLGQVAVGVVGVRRGVEVAVLGARDRPVGVVGELDEEGPRGRREVVGDRRQVALGVVAVMHGVAEWPSFSVTLVGSHWLPGRWSA
jgi:hypothetical protein